MESKKEKKDGIIESFTVEDLELVLVKPTVHILREAKFVYNKAFTSALKEGFSTKKKLEEQLKQGEVNIIDLHITRRTEILNLYVETNTLLASSTDPDLIEYYAGLLSFYRDSLVREDTEMTNLFATTADQYAEDSRIEYLTFSLIRMSDRTQIWKTKEEYAEDTRINLVEACKYHVICWEYSLDPNWQETLPETKALEKVLEMRTELHKQEESEAKSLELKEVETTEKDSDIVNKVKEDNIVKDKPNKKTRISKKKNLKSKESVEINAPSS